jgi:hypothetical protein
MFGTIPVSRRARDIDNRPGAKLFETHQPVANAMTRDQIIDAIRMRGERLRELRVASLHIFGSMARDEAGPESDVDVLVDFEGPPSFDRYMDLKFFLEDLIGRPVDLVTRAAVRPRMRLAIEREAVRVS